MASHVVVVDSSARRATVKTIPSSLLTEVLQQACKKLGRDPESHVLKHNNKTLDLSLTIRLSGLVTGARLELVLSSRSPSVISIALQLPESDSQGLNRLTEKFSSRTSLWMLLRHFESLSSAGKFNFTGRGVPGSDGATTNLLYETPILQIMNREYASFVDLQKTLAQLGFNSGNVLVRLSFRKTETPFEEAKRQISQYFAIDGAEEKAPADASLSRDDGHLESQDEEGPSYKTHDSTSSNARLLDADTPSGSHEPNPDDEVIARKPSAQVTAAIPDSERNVIILAAPTSNTPQAARNTFDEKDYIPTVDHAKSHQSRLSLTGANKRLPSDAELLARANENRQHLENVHEVEIKFRFPDQMQSVSKFQRQDSAQSAYDFVKGLMANANEPFTLRYNSPSGMESLPKGDLGHLKLIADIKLEGRILVNVVWDEGASAEARTSPVLKHQYRQQAREIVVPTLQTESLPDEIHPPQIEQNKSEESKGRKTGVPKWLRLPGKK